MPPSGGGLLILTGVIPDVTDQSDETDSSCSVLFAKDNLAFVDRVRFERHILLDLAPVGLRLVAPHAEHRCANGYGALAALGTST